MHEWLTTRHVVVTDPDSNYYGKDGTLDLANWQGETMEFEIVFSGNDKTTYCIELNDAIIAIPLWRDMEDEDDDEIRTLQQQLPYIQEDLRQLKIIIINEKVPKEVRIYARKHFNRLIGVKEPLLPLG